MNDLDILWFLGVFEMMVSTLSDSHLFLWITNLGLTVALFSLVGVLNHEN